MLLFIAGIITGLVFSAIGTIVALRWRSREPRGRADRNQHSTIFSADRNNQNVLGGWPINNL